MSIMLYIPMIGNYLKILNDDEVKDFVVINFDEHFHCMRENCILNQVRNKILEKVLNQINLSDKT